MTAYRFIWWTTATVLVAVGAAAAMVYWSIPATLVIFACAALLTATITFVAQDEDSPHRQTAVISTNILLSGVGAVALLGLGAMLGAVVIAVVVVVAASSPLAIGYYRRIGASANQGRDENEAARRQPVADHLSLREPASSPVESGLRNMDDAALCRAWRRSYWSLKDTTSPAERLTVLQARQRYLDELERRYPGALVDWFESGARPGGDPGAFLARTVKDSAVNDFEPSTPMGDKPTHASVMPLEDTDLVVTGDEADVRGRTVVDRTGTEIGEIDGLLVDTDERKVRFLQVNSGDLLGIGARRQLIPIDAVTRVEDDKVTIAKDREHVVEGPVSEPDLEQAPGRGFYEGIYGHYGYAPFWAPGYVYPRYPHY